MSTIFTKIVNREIPGHIVAEDEKHLAFLDINPLVMGHTLVIPKQEVNYIFDMDDEALSELHAFSKKVAKAIEKVVPCARIGVTVIGLEVPHAHIHLIPINGIADMNFANPKLKPSQDELAELAEKIKESYD